MGKELAQQNINFNIPKMLTPPPNYTQTPNDLFDHWLPFLSEAELKVLLVIMRKTFGWHKTHDVISISQLTHHTGMLRETVIRAAKSLQNKGVISREVTGSNGKQRTIYSLVITDTSNNYYQSDDPTGPVGLNQPVKSDPQKKPSTKEKQQQPSKKKSATPPDKPPSASVVVSLSKIKINQTLAKELSKKYSVLEIDTAVDRLLRGKFDCHAKGIRWLLANPDKWQEPAEKPDIAKKKEQEKKDIIAAENRIWAEDFLKKQKKHPFTLKDKFVEYRDKKGAFGRIEYALSKNSFKDMIIYISREI